MGVGRPTTFTPEVMERARDYVDNCPDIVPLIVGLCRHIGRSKTSVYDWAKDEGKEEFADILEQVHELQEIKLVTGGLTGEFNSPIAKMMLTKHGYSDKQELDHTSSDRTMSPKGLGDFYSAFESDE